MVESIPRIREIHIKNYRSIAKAVVSLNGFTALVGPNGAGKTNFVDALSFVQECLSDSIELAFKHRGGIGVVRRKSGGHPTHIAMRLIIDLSPRRVADYSFEIAAKPRERFSVAKERCVVTDLDGGFDRFSVASGEFREAIPGVRAQLTDDRLALFIASATEEFRSVYDFLTGMRFYSIAPERVRELQDPDAGDHLKRDGSNAAAVLKRLKDDEPQTHEKVCRLLAKVVQGVERVDYRAVGQKETLEFKQDVGLRDPWTFEALNMSDGTLRMLGVLLAVYQATPPSLVAIEEPEATVHPAAAEVLTSVLLDASTRSQVVVTTHSPDILDHKELSDEQLRVVSKRDGKTLIAPMAEAGRRAIRERLYTAGELLRHDELDLDADSAKESAGQLNIFGKHAVPQAFQEMTVG